MTRDALYKLVGAYIEKCNRCGDCRAVCPVFAQNPSETAVARGKLLLAGRLLRGEIGLSETLRDRLDSCLLCQSCSSQCAFHLRVDRVMMATRAILAQEMGIPIAKRALFRLLGSGSSLMTLLCGAGALTAPLWGKQIPETSGLRLRFPPGGPLDGSRMLPKPVARPFRGRVATYHPAENPRGTVAFFTGCYINYLAPSVGAATLRLLNRAGFSVQIPRSQECCGTPITASGGIETATDLMRRNLESLLALKVDAVVTACATCGTALRDLYPGLLGKLEPALEEKAQRLAERSFDIAEFLVKQGAVPAGVELKQGIKATYHDSCHLGRSQGVRDQPRQLLKGIDNLELVEMEGADACCGFGGAFSFTQREISRQICSRKIGSIAKTEAEVVISGCHGCNLQIAEGLAREGLSARVLHTVEMLESAYTQCRESKGGKSI